MFPISLYSDYQLEHQYGLSHQEFGDWFVDFLKAMLLELGLGVVFFTVLYALLAWSPDFWWIGATIFYVLFTVVLTTIAPLVILPMFHDLKPLEDDSLVSTIKEYMQNAGLNVIGVFKWGLSETTGTANAALAGLGKTRRIILGDTMLEGYTREEILAVLAHEVGHYKHRDMTRILLVSTALSGLGFFVANACLHALVRSFGFSGVADIAAFPILIGCLLVFSLVTMPLSNTYSRRREFAADSYAVRSLKKADPLVSALEKLASQNLADKTPAAWIEFLLHSHPSISRRVKRARDAEVSSK
jgi:STE24 endopeptidase